MAEGPHVQGAPAGALHLCWLQGRAARSAAMACGLSRRVRVAPWLDDILLKRWSAACASTALG